jgi:hypothetical protein
MPQLQCLEISQDGESTTATLPVGANFNCTLTIRDGVMSQAWSPSKPGAGDLPTRYGSVLRKAMRDTMRAHAGKFGLTRGVF